jgi:hypothetical protein
VLGRLIGLLSIPIMLFTIWGLIRQVRKEQRVKLSTPVIGLIMAPLSLLVNLLFMHQAVPYLLGPMLLILGLGFGLAWGQTNRLYQKEGNLVGKRSWLHLVFWAISYIITQVLASFASAWYVAGGLATMFFSTGSTLGTNLNLLSRQLLMRKAGYQPTTKTTQKPAGLPEGQTGTTAIKHKDPLPPDLPEGISSFS